MSFENPGINGVQALLGKDDTMGLMEIQKKREVYSTSISWR